MPVHVYGQSVYKPKHITYKLSPYTGTPKLSLHTVELSGPDHSFSVDYRVKIATVKKQLWQETRI